MVVAISIRDPVARCCTYSLYADTRSSANPHGSDLWGTLPWRAAWAGFRRRVFSGEFRYGAGGFDGCRRNKASCRAPSGSSERGGGGRTLAAPSLRVFYVGGSRLIDMAARRQLLRGAEGWWMYGAWAGVDHGADGRADATGARV